MKVISWNIWRGKNLDKIIELLKQEKPDIVGLQEVKGFLKGDEKLSSAQTIAEKLGYQFFYQKAFTTDRHYPPYDIGNALLTKLPIREQIGYELSGIADYEGSAITEPRGAVEVKIISNGTEVSFLSTHLAYSDNLADVPIRQKQLNKLLQAIGQRTVVLMGDFNALPKSETIQTLSKVLVNADPVSRVPTWNRHKDNHNFRIDYIFVSPNVRYENFRVLKSQASDHQPIAVEIIIAANLKTTC